MHSNPGLHSCVTLGTLPDLSLSYFSHCQHKGNITAHAIEGLPRWHSGKEPTCQGRRCKRHRFDPWVGNISWRRKWQSTPVFFPGKSHGQRGLVGYSPWVAKSQTRLSEDKHQGKSLCWLLGQGSVRRLAVSDSLQLMDCSLNVSDL